MQCHMSRREVTQIPFAGVLTVGKTFHAGSLPARGSISSAQTTAMVFTKEKYSLLREKAQRG